MKRFGNICSQYCKQLRGPGDEFPSVFAFQNTGTCINYATYCHFHINVAKGLSSETGKWYKDSGFQCPHIYFSHHIQKLKLEPQKVILRKNYFPRPDIIKGRLVEQTWRNRTKRLNFFLYKTSQEKYQALSTDIFNLQPIILLPHTCIQVYFIEEIVQDWVWYILKQKDLPFVQWYQFVAITRVYLCLWNMNFILLSLPNSTSCVTALTG